MTLRHGFKPGKARRVAIGAVACLTWNTVPAEEPPDFYAISTTYGGGELKHESVDAKVAKAIPVFFDERKSRKNVKALNGKSKRQARRLKLEEILLKYKNSVLLQCTYRERVDGTRGKTTTYIFVAGEPGDFESATSLLEINEQHPYLLIGRSLFGCPLDRASAEKYLRHNLLGRDYEQELIDELGERSGGRFDLLSTLRPFQTGPFSLWLQDGFRCHKESVQNQKDFVIIDSPTGMDYFLPAFSDAMTQLRVLLKARCRGGERAVAYIEGYSRDEMVRSFQLAPARKSVAADKMILRESGRKAVQVLGTSPDYLLLDVPLADVPALFGETGSRANARVKLLSRGRRLHDKIARSTTRGTAITPPGARSAQTAAAAAKPDWFEAFEKQLGAELDIIAFDETVHYRTSKGGREENHKTRVSGLRLLSVDPNGPLARASRRVAPGDVLTDFSSSQSLWGFINKYGVDENTGKPVKLQIFHLDDNLRRRESATLSVPVDVDFSKPIERRFSASRGSWCADSAGPMPDLRLPKGYKPRKPIQIAGVDTSSDDIYEDMKNAVVAIAVVNEYGRKLGDALELARKDYWRADASASGATAAQAHELAYWLREVRQHYGMKQLYGGTGLGRLVMVFASISSEYDKQPAYEYLLANPCSPLQADDWKTYLTGLLRVLVWDAVDGESPPTGVAPWNSAQALQAHLEGRLNNKPMNEEHMQSAINLFRNRFSQRRVYEAPSLGDWLFRYYHEISKQAQTKTAGVTRSD